MIWYEDEVIRVEQELSRLAYEPETLFYGSSSITLWNTLYSDFRAYHPINLGFGGSTIAACSWFFYRIAGPILSDKRIVIYAGDNDLGDGRNPEEVYLFYKLLIEQVRKKFGGIPCYFISIKPSIQRWDIIGKIKTANRLIREETLTDTRQTYIDIFPLMLDKQGIPSRVLFEPDGLHLSHAGYQVWKEAILMHIEMNETSKQP